MDVSSMDLLRTITRKDSFIRISLMQIVTGISVLIIEWGLVRLKKYHGFTSYELCKMDLRISGKASEANKKTY